MKKKRKAQMSWSGYNPRQKNGGGHPSAVFFWTLWLAGLAVTGWLGGVLSTAQDTLLAAVPKSAIAYAHAAGSGLPEAMLAGLPDGLAPDETAIFWSYRTEAAPERVILLGWKRPPTVNEKFILARADALSVDGRLYALLASDDMQTDIERARWENLSLNDDADIRDALAYARALLPMQVWLDPGGIISAKKPLDAYLADLPPTVFAADLRNGFTAYSLPVATATNLNPVFARLPKPKTGHQSQKAPPLPEAPMEFRAKAGMIDLTPLVLPEDGDATGRFGLASSKLAVQTLISGDLKTTIATKDGDNRFVTYLPGVDADGLTEALVDYLARRYPSSRTAQLPDGGEYKEIIADRSGIKIDDHGENALKTIKIPGKPVIYAIRKEKNGLILSNSLKLISSTPNALPPNTAAKTLCRNLADDYAIPYLKEQISQTMPFFSWFPEITRFEAAEVVDNFTVLCGYHANKVDNPVDETSG